MHKHKIARVQAGTNGGVEVVLCLTPEIIATAEESARRLQVTSEEVLTAYFTDLAGSQFAPDAIREYIPEGWVFPTKERADAFIEREQLDTRRYFTEQYESGGWAITDTADYSVEYPDEQAVPA